MTKVNKLFVKAVKKDYFLKKKCLNLQVKDGILKKLERSISYFFFAAIGKDTL